MWGRSVRAVLVAAVLAVAAAPAHAAVPATSLTARDYLAFADRLQVALNPAWDAKAGAYRTSRTLFVRVNAAMLYAHANAALAGHTGASRQDVLEALLHVAIYAGVPRANHAIKIAKETFAEMEETRP